MTDRVIYDHLAGKQTIGVYPLLSDDSCYFLAADFDEADWREDAKAFMQSCRELGIPVALEISRSGNGAHAWIFFAEPVPAREARQLGAALISHTCDRTRQLSLASYDRLFPNQDTMPKGGFGNLIALPLQKQPRESGRSVFVDEQLQPHSDQWAFTEEMGWIPKGWKIASLSKIANLNPESWTAKTAPAQLQYVDLANTKNGRINLIVPYQFADAPSRARRVLRQDDTIIGTVRPGNRSFAYIHDDDLTGSTGFAVMRPTEKCFRSFVYLCLTRNEVIDHFAHLADGGAYPAIRPVVAGFTCAQPEKELFAHFDKLVSPWIHSIGEREAAIKSLSMLRDTLLPKLLSGEIRVPDVEKLVEVAV